VKRRIMIGTYVLSHGYYDAYYLQAQKLRRMIADDFQACFKQCDLIAGPVAPSVAWKIGEQGADPLQAYLADIFTLPASLAGLPGMSVPAGFARSATSHGMPVGLQLIGNYFAEGQLLHAAHALQQACGHEHLAHHKHGPHQQAHHIVHKSRFAALKIIAGNNNYIFTTDFIQTAINCSAKTFILFNNKFKIILSL
jgi:Asp-tRNA(Asn)/Glu-tRNA(Gln) amidotransferase A subunit family amidase